MDILETEQKQHLNCDGHNMKKQKNKLTIRSTKKPQTFFLKYNLWSPTKSYLEERKIYEKASQELVDEVNEMGIKANLKIRFKSYSYYYITFRSKYDAAAFKLGWM